MSVKEFCAVRLKRKKKPEGLARIQAGGKRSATPATGRIGRKPRVGGRILQQCVFTLLLCHPFGVLDTLTSQRRGCTPACGLPPLRGFGYSHFSAQGLYPCLWSATPSGFIGVNWIVRSSFVFLVETSINCFWGSLKFSTIQKINGLEILQIL